MQVDFNARTGYYTQRNWRLLQQAFEMLELDYVWAPFCSSLQANPLKDRAS